MIRSLNKKDFNNFLDFCSHKDQYSDFYITENNERKYLTDLQVAKRVFNRCLKSGDKCFVKSSDGDIQGVLLITGFADGFNRKYISVFGKTKKDLEDLFQYLNWKKIPNLYIKVKKYNKYLVKYNNQRNLYYPSYCLKKAGFYIKALRGRELLITNKDTNNVFRKHNK